MIVSPCKDCEQRQLHCHSQCEEYRLFKTELECYRRRKHIYSLRTDYGARVNSHKPFARHRGA